MKIMMSVLFAMIVALALVSSGEAGTGSSYNDNPGVFFEAHNTTMGVSTKDVDRAGNDTEGIRSNCILSAHAAYTDYIDAREVCSTTNTKGRRVPDVMGSW